MAVLFIGLFFAFTVLPTGFAASYGYSDQASWYDNFQQCSYKRQSPIELNTADAKITYDLPKLYFQNYEMLYPRKVVVENNGRTVNLNLPKLQGIGTTLGEKILTQILPQIYGGPFDADRFIAESVHFHWGSKDSHGSEHVIDSNRYTMEMHVLHKNVRYETVEEAKNHTDGLAVTAFLFHAAENNMDYPGLNSLIEVLERVQEYNTTTEIESFFNLATLIGDQLDSEDYFTYKGSLTTPPCSESVTWVVLTKVLDMSHAQLKEFQNLRDENHQILENNYRALQAKGSRIVTLRKTHSTI